MLIGRELRQRVFNTGSQVKLLARDDDAICYGFEGRSISLPASLELGRASEDAQARSHAVRHMRVLQQAANSYLEERQKKAFGMIEYPSCRFAQKGALEDGG